MESLWYLPSLVVIALGSGVIVWQALITTEYERTQKEECEEKVEQLQAKLEDQQKRYHSLKLEKEKVDLLLMSGVNRVVIGAGAQVGQLAAGTHIGQEKIQEAENDGSNG